MEILDKLLGASYFMAVAASILGAGAWWLEYRKAEWKKPFLVFGMLASVFLASAFFIIIISVGPHPIASGYILKIAIRVAVIGYAASKLSFEIMRLSNFVSVDPKAASKSDG